MALEGKRKRVDIAEELGIHFTSLNDWVKDYEKNKENAFPGSGKLRPEDEELRRLRRENENLKEEVEILKKAAGNEAKAAIFEYIEIFYNRYRLHSSNGYVSPIKKREAA